MIQNSTAASKITISTLWPINTTILNLRKRVNLHVQVKLIMRRNCYLCMKIRLSDRRFQKSAYPFILHQIEMCITKMCMVTLPNQGFSLKKLKINAQCHQLQVKDYQIHDNFQKALNLKIALIFLKVILVDSQEKISFIVQKVKDLIQQLIKKLVSSTIKARLFPYDFSLIPLSFMLFIQIYKMNSSNEFQMVGKEGILTKSILTEKKFHVNSIDWDYQNNFHLAMLDEDASSKLKIKNHLCQMNGNAMKKITQIIYKDKVYTIEDTYLLRTPQNQTNYQSQQFPKEARDGISTNANDSGKNETKDKPDEKKVYIFKKMKPRKFETQGEQEKWRNTKNVSKNFSKAFIAYLRSDQVKMFERRKIRQAIKAYNTLNDCKKYNNNFIKKIIAHELLRDIFKTFLETSASNWIRKSKVNDKDLHYDAIPIYLHLYETLPQRKQSDQHMLSSSEQSSISQHQNKVQQ